MDQSYSLFSDYSRHGIIEHFSMPPVRVNVAGEAKKLEALRSAFGSLTAREPLIERALETILGSESVRASIRQAGIAAAMQMTAIIRKTVPERA